jgi:hypothetical protein
MFVHSGSAGGAGLVQQAAVGEMAAAAFSGVAPGAGTIGGWRSPDRRCSATATSAGVPRIPRRR